MTGQPTAELDVRPPEEAMCRILDWDTNFFGFTVATATRAQLTPAGAKKIMLECAESRVRCLYFLADAGDRNTISLLEQHNFALKDIRFTMISRTGASASLKSGLPVREAEQADIPHLRRIARTSHYESRFYADANFPSERCDDLYDLWITKSCAHENADIVLVADLGGNAAGYITCKRVTPLRGQIGLFAVAEEARGRGVGNALIRHAMDWFHNGGISDVVTVTQGENVRAVQFYERAGFVVENVQLWYHRWFDQC